MWSFPPSPHDGVEAIPAVDGVAPRRGVLDENDVASGRLEDGVVAATERNDVAKPRAGDNEALVTGIGVIERRVDRQRSLSRERRLHGHGRAVEVQHELGLCRGRDIRAGSRGRRRRRQEHQRLGPIQLADEMLVAVGIDPLEVRLEPETGHLRREVVVAFRPLQDDRARRRGRTVAIDHMNMFCRIKALMAEEGRNPWLIPVDDATCLAQHVIVPPIHIDVRGIRLVHIHRRIDKVGGVADERPLFSLVRLTDGDRH